MEKNNSKTAKKIDNDFMLNHRDWRKFLVNIDKYDISMTHMIPITDMLSKICF